MLGNAEHRYNTIQSRYVVTQDHYKSPPPCQHVTHDSRMCTCRCGSDVERSIHLLHILHMYDVVPWLGIYMRAYNYVCTYILLQTFGWLAAWHFVVT